MKELIRRWLSIPTLYDPAELFRKLQEAQKEHISDLRVLIDKGNEREAMLAGILQQSLSKTNPQRATERTENPIRPAIDIEHLSDVAVFDEEADAAEVQRQEDMYEELRQIADEQATAGINKP